MTRTTISVGSMLTIVVEDDGDPAVAQRVTILEDQMTGALSDIEAIKADFAGYRSDVNAKLASLAQQVATLEAAVAANDPAAVDSALADLTAGVDSARSEVGDADGDGTPTPAAADAPAEASGPADAAAAGETSGERVA